MALNNYSFQFGSFVIGNGTPFVIESVDGLEALPEVRTQDDNRGFADGMYTGRDFFGGRTITMDILTIAGNGNSAFTNFNLLQAAMNVQSSGTTTMQFTLSPYDNQQQIGARVRARKTTVNPEYTFGYIKSSYQLFCPDPRYYDATATTVSLLPNTSLGRTYNKTYNVTYGGGVAGATITNNGNVTTYPVITINGPMTNPTIGNNTTGQFITVNYTLGASDVLVIDLYEKTITLNGSPARNLLAGNSQWFGADPGVTNFQFTGTGYSGSTAASVTYRSAWI
jgi:Phage tail protein